MAAIFGSMGRGIDFAVKEIKRANPKPKPTHPTEVIQSKGAGKVTVDELIPEITAFGRRVSVFHLDMEDFT
jgi:hypothetical protein